MAAPSPRSGLPQGFSVYQPALGAPLQFFPALGSAQLDELIGAYVAGPAAVQDKRASVSVDFLAHAQRTGQSFKFYPVQAAAESPLAASPSLDSASSSSSFNVSPVTSSWDWSATASVSSRSSARRARRPASPPRHQPPVDFSHLPGMKILTKDGLDVTNSASRGSKTKEQRDHAHLMRIIKACDSCRRKKIRCDPSHKKRAPAQPPLSAATGSRPSRKPRTTSTTTTTPREQAAPPPSQPPQPSAQDHCAQTALESTDFEALLTPSLHFDPAFSSSLAGLESWDPSAAAVADDAWEEFLQFPPMDASPDYDLYIDPDTYFSSHSSSVQSSSASPLKPMTPQTQDEPGAPPGFDAFDVDGLQKAASTYPFLDPSVPASDYTDFNLFSPASSFSEDERMLPIGTSLSQMPELARSTSSDGVVPDYGGLGFGRSLSESSEASSRPDMPLLDGGDGGCGLANYSAFDPAALHNTEPGPQPAWAGTLSSSSESPHDQVILLCPPGTVVLSAQGSGRVPTKASPSLDHPGCGADPGDSNKPIAECAPGVPAGHVDAPAVGLRSELPAVVAPHDLVAARAASDPRHGLPDVRQAVLQDGLGRQQPADHGIRASTPETKRLQNSASQDRIAVPASGSRRASGDGLAAAGIRDSQPRGQLDSSRAPAIGCPVDALTPISMSPTDYVICPADLPATSDGLGASIQHMQRAAVTTTTPASSPPGRATALSDIYPTVPGPASGQLNAAPDASSPNAVTHGQVVGPEAATRPQRTRTCAPEWAVLAAAILFVSAIRWASSPALTLGYAVCAIPAVMARAAAWKKYSSPGQRSTGDPPPRSAPEASDTEAKISNGGVSGHQRSRATGLCETGLACSLDFLRRRLRHLGGGSWCGLPVARSPHNTAPGRSTAATSSHRARTGPTPL